jgi:hypothetical protein
MGYPLAVRRAIKAQPFEIHYSLALVRYALHEWNHDRSPLFEIPDFPLSLTTVKSDQRFFVHFKTFGEIPQSLALLELDTHRSGIYRRIIVNIRKVKSIRHT